MACTNFRVFNSVAPEVIAYLIAQRLSSGLCGDRPECGRHAVQVLHTNPDPRLEQTNFAPHGERSVAHGYRKALGRAPARRKVVTYGFAQN
jgi:hypothetical protein